MKVVKLISGILIASMLFLSPALAELKLVVGGSEATGSLLDRMALKFEELLKQKAWQ